MSISNPNISTHVFKQHGDFHDVVKALVRYIDAQCKVTIKLFNSVKVKTSMRPIEILSGKTVKDVVEEFNDWARS